MADINVSYEEMRSSVSKLNAGKEEIESKLQSLKTMINGLVAGPFKTQSASGKFQESYEAWTRGASEAIKGLDGMTQFLNTAIQKHQELDTELTHGV